MKNISRITIASLLIIVVFASNPAKAGNHDRSGQAAAAHLLINPWASTNGWGTAGVSFTKGIEAMYANVAGMAFTQKTEIGYSNTLYNVGSQTMINGLGIVQSLGKGERDGGNLGVSAMIMSFGDIPRTTVEQPEGGLGTFSSVVTNIGISYARSFSPAIHAGVSFKVINESTSNANAQGFAIDLGVQYVSGRNNQFRLGVVLKNIGLPMRYRGDGLDLRAYLNKGFPTTVLVPTESSEMPALLGLGISYDFLFDKDGRPGKKLSDREDAMHRLTIAGSYVANAYSRDQIILGLEYSLMDFFQVRCGYTVENFRFEEVEEINKDGNGKVIKKEKLIINTNNNLSGPSAGMSVLIPLSKNTESPSRIAIDYSYRFTKTWNGCHAIGVRLIL